VLAAAQNGELLMAVLASLSSSSSAVAAASTSTAALDVTFLSTKYRGRAEIWRQLTALMADD